MFEIKWDGVRAIAEMKDGKTTLWARSGRDVTSEYPEFKDLAEKFRVKQRDRRWRNRHARRRWAQQFSKAAESAGRAESLAKADAVRPARLLSHST